MTKYHLNFNNWTKASIKNSNFILAEAKDYVSYLSAESDRITERAFSMIRILIPVVIILTTLIIRSVSQGEIGWIEICAILSLIFGLYIIFQFYRLTFPRVFMPIGRDPRELENISFYGMDENLSTEEAELSLCLNEIENCANKIKFNENQNLFRTSKLKVVMRITFWGILICSAVTILGELGIQLFLV